MTSSHGAAAVTLDDIKRFRQLDSNTPGPSRISADLRRRDHDRAARPGLRQQRRHGDRRALAGRSTSIAPGFDAVRLRRLRALRRRRHDGRRRQRGGVARRSSAARRTCAGSTTTTTITIEGHTELAFSEDVGDALSWAMAGTSCGSPTPTTASGSRRRIETVHSAPPTGRR